MFIRIHPRIRNHKRYSPVGESDTRPLQVRGEFDQNGLVFLAEYRGGLVHAARVDADGAFRGHCQLNDFVF
jgi:hypothetical protein